jgi:trehalose 6-phosphate synthase
MRKNNFSIIVASNRGPAKFNKSSDGLTVKRGSGGLVTALSSVLEDIGGLWISSAITAADKELAKEGKLIDFPPGENLYKLKFVHTEEKEFDLFYNKISNELLWFCNHYLWSISQEPLIDDLIIDAWNSGYMSVNKKFAEQIEEAVLEYDKKSIVMLQDYHLLTAATFLREKVIDLPICHFSHTTWPNPEYFGILPQKIRDDIFAGMLSNDIVGFQSERYAQNFILCCQRFTDYKYENKRKAFLKDGRLVKVRVYPISIDYKTTAKEANSSLASELAKKFATQNKNLKIIVRVERADPTKNTVRGLLAYGLMLKKNPELLGKIKYLVFLHSSRAEISLYRDNMNKIKAVAEQINQKYGQGDWQPLELSIEDNYSRSLAALKIYDVLVVNPLFDGMNLVSKEGPIVNEKNGVLILSKNTGAYDELKANALTVNPFDIDETADQMFVALNMKIGKRKKMRESLAKIVKDNTAENWAYSQIEDLAKITS